ncbi:MAG TPA: tryptophan halogenase family protein [Rhodanobacteraceae bacterium]|jgi:glycine/D-amino acid oxidase-like deaminating enzyme|nr:tryptophan halogenase family protein [Rhodanobacteraceae bacterium]
MSEATATVFNRNVVARGPARIDAEPPVKHVVVVGGGTAGWMTALLLASSAYGTRLKVTVLESPQVGVIGVGEGSTPWLRGFFESLGIEEAEWMPECHATYKAGITFDGWSTRPGYESYFHSFASMLDNMTMAPFIDNVHARLDRADVYAHPNRFFISARLARECKAPRPQASFPFDVWYGFHFDSVLLGKFLQKKSVERGVRHLAGHAADVQLGASGDIASLRLQDGSALAGDFYVDCTGFASLLIGKALGTPFVSFKDNLFNDAAVALQAPHDGPIQPQTISTALRHGWAWKIPLTTRYGYGHVYSSDFCTAENAERELREHLGLQGADVQARHLKFRPGRVAEPWRRNCVANGLAQSFIEPLEATTLLFVQRTAEMLVAALEKGDLGEATRKQFNDTLNGRVEGTRDYIVTHFKTNTRTDTEYWRANAANTHLSEPLQQLLRTWLASKPISPGIAKGTFGRGYPIMSWYSLLAGVGLFPHDRETRPPTPQEAKYDMAEVDTLLDRSATNFPDHRAFLRAIPPKPRPSSLQVYFW